MVVPGLGHQRLGLLKRVLEGNQNSFEPGHATREGLNRGIWPKLIALAAVTLFLAAFVTLTRSGRKGIRIEGEKLTLNGKTVYLRGVMYFQPHAFHQFFWEEMDSEKMREDLSRIAEEGFNAIAVQVNWGSFTSRVNETARSFEANSTTENRLEDLLCEARRRGLIVILWFGVSRVPQGVDAKLYPASTDAGGRHHGSFYGYLLHNYPGIAYFQNYTWRRFLEFHERVARITSRFGNVIYDPLDWQHLNINPWTWGDPLNLKAWRRYLMETNPDLDFWNRRWGEHNRGWDEVLLPVDVWVRNTAARLPNSPYAAIPESPYTSAKWRDFARWQDELYLQVARQIIEAVRRGNPRAVIGQRVDLWRYGQYRNRTWGPPGVDLYFAGDYPQNREEADDASRVVDRTLGILRSHGARELPAIFWETGIDVRSIYPSLTEEAREEKRAYYIVGLDEECRRRGLLGWCWWVWRDYYLNEQSKDWGLVDENGGEKPAAMAFERLAKPEGS